MECAFSIWRMTLRERSSNYKFLPGWANQRNVYTSADTRKGQWPWEEKESKSQIPGDSTQSQNIWHQASSKKNSCSSHMPNTKIKWMSPSWKIMMNFVNHSVWVWKMIQWTQFTQNLLEISWAFCVRARDTEINRTNPLTSKNLNETEVRYMLQPHQHPTSCILTAGQVLR